MSSAVPPYAPLHGFRAAVLGPESRFGDCRAREVRHAIRSCSPRPGPPADRRACPGLDHRCREGCRRAACCVGVAVEASSLRSSRARRVVTDGAGHTGSRFAAGHVRCHVHLTGFRLARWEGIELTGSFDATVDAELTVGSLQEAVTVTDDAPAVDVRNTSGAGDVPAEMIDALPAARSQYLIAALLPGTTKPVRRAGCRRHADDAAQQLLDSWQPRARISAS